MAWRGVFESFDANGSGKISRDELDAVLREMHGGDHGYDAEALQRFLQQNDKDGDAELDYEEFLQWIRHN
ncbi:hypothetical protein BOX15_Mlig025708g2 [Macrostomum lignano]|nr:hypothetical protein BOX15_Mlig025708g2 [Macrostomum lignano]